MKKIITLLIMLIFSVKVFACIFYATVSPSVLCLPYTQSLSINLNDYNDFFTGITSPSSLTVKVGGSVVPFTYTDNNGGNDNDCLIITIANANLNLTSGAHSIDIIYGTHNPLTVQYNVVNAGGPYNTSIMVNSTTCNTVCFNVNSALPQWVYGGNNFVQQQWVIYPDYNFVPTLYSEYAYNSGIWTNTGNHLDECYFELSCHPIIPNGFLHWDFGDGTSGDFPPKYVGSNTLCHTYPHSGNYTVTITNLSTGDCISSIVLQVSANGAYINAGTDQTTCNGSSAQLNATGGISYSWTPTSGLSNPNIANPIATPSTTTTYTVSSANANGCSGTDNVVVTVLSIPDFAISGSNNNCALTCQYNVSNFNYPAYSYSWSVNGGTANTFTSNPFTINWGPGGINLPNGGTITVTATKTGCTKSSTFIVYMCCGTTTPYTYNDAVINSAINPITNSTIVINGTLRITNNGTFYPTVNWETDQVYFGPYAKIIIDPGCTLEIAKNCVLQACNSIMWDGIYVTSNSHHPALVNISSSTIKDAINGIVSIAGGRYNISTSTLTNNYKNIVVHYYNGNHLGHISSTLITCTGLLLNPYSNRGTYIGIEADSVKYLFVGDSIIPAKNHFDIINYGTVQHSIYGIKATDSYVKVYNNWFSNIKANVSFINPTHVDDYAIYTNAINISGSYPLAKLKVGDYYIAGYFKRNIFQNCENGIFTVDNKYVDITSNRLEYTTGGNNWGEAINISFNTQSVAPVNIFSDTVVTYKKGIHLVNSNASTLKCNTINLKEPLTTQSYYSRGIFTENCQNASIYSNYVTGPTGGNGDYRIEGLRIESGPGTIMNCNSSTIVGRAITFGGVCIPGTSISKNNMLTYMDGFFLNWASIGQQGYATSPNDNTWMTIGTRNSDTYAFYSDGTQSPFYVSNSNASYIPTINGSYSGFPIPITQTTGFSYVRCNLCGGGAMLMDQSLPSVAVSNELTDIAQGASIAQMTNENKWLAKYFLYKDVLLNNLSASGILTSFMQANENSDIGKLLQLNNLIENGNYLSAQSAISSISTYTNMAANLKSFYDLYSANLSSGNKYSISIAQKATLSGLAQQCPYEYGPAVYHARAYLKACGDTTEYVNSCEILLSATSNAKLVNINNAVSELPISVYPNPAKDKLNITSTLLVGTTGEVNIYDEVGNKVLTVNFTEGKNSMEVNLSNIAAGVYYYKILVEKQMVKSDKLVIIK